VWVSTQVLCSCFSCLQRRCMLSKRLQAHITYVHVVLDCGKCVILRHNDKTLIKNLVSQVQSGFLVQHSILTL
jgi:hypothetical protein